MGDEEVHWTIAVHVGAGYHAPDKGASYKKACQTACLIAKNILVHDGHALDAAVAAIRSLEDDPITNAGVGSALTEKGTVECDAAVMDGQDGRFAAVGAISGVKNPIDVANQLLNEDRSKNLDFGRIRPIFLAGEAARDWAEKRGIQTYDPKEKEILLTESSLQTYENILKMMNHDQKRNKLELEVEHLRPADDISDTVGAICLDSKGNLAAAVSTGGIGFKSSGRIGDAPIYGCGCWAVNSDTLSPIGIACSATGTGEHIMKTLLCKSFGDLLMYPEESTDQTIQTLFQKQFLDSFFLKHVNKKHAGLILLRHDTTSNQVEFIYGHTTSSMGLGYMTSTMNQPIVRRVFKRTNIHP